MPKTVPDSPSAPAPLGPYSVATAAAGLVFISGQVAVDADTRERTQGGVRDQTRKIMENLAGILGDLGLTFDDVVKTTIFLEDIADFQAVNEVYAEALGDARPARSTIQAGALPGGFQVEIEAIAAT